jgi:hypothetical protein
MQEQLSPSSIAPGHAASAMRWSLALLVAAGVVYLVHYAPAARPEPATVRFDPSCEASDQAASAAVASLITERSAAVEAKLADAVFRLRRARKYCSYGWRALAEQDYQALLDGRYRRNP